MFFDLGTAEFQYSVNISFTLYLSRTSTSRIFFNLIFSVMLVSLVPKCSIMRYLRCHLGIIYGSGIFGLLAFLAFFFAFWPHDIFLVIYVFWNFGIRLCLALWSFDILFFFGFLPFGIFFWHFGLFGFFLGGHHETQD